MTQAEEIAAGLSEAMARAVRMLGERGGSGVINRYGRVLAGGDILPPAPETWLRLVSLGVVGPAGQNRIGLTEPTGLEVRALLEKDSSA